MSNRITSGWNWCKIVAQKLRLTTSNPNNAKPNVGSSFCLLGQHIWGGFDGNICLRCNKKAVGLPKFKNPPKCPTKPL